MTSPEDGLVYPTVEHAFQGAKSENIAERMRIQQLATPGDAKRAGRRLNMRKDWEDVKKLIMFRLVLAKFTEDGQLGAWLIETEDRLLVEGNTWGDQYWGMAERASSGRAGTTSARSSWQCGW